MLISVNLYLRYSFTSRHDFVLQKKTSSQRIIVVFIMSCCDWFDTTSSTLYLRRNKASRIQQNSRKKKIIRSSVNCYDYCYHGICDHLADITMCLQQMQYKWEGGSLRQKNRVCQGNAAECFGVFTFVMIRVFRLHFLSQICYKTRILISEPLIITHLNCFVSIEGKWHLTQKAQ